MLRADTIALFVALSALAQSSGSLPLTVEVRRDVEVTPYSNSPRSRGRLYLDDLKAKAFRLKKGQRFQTIEIGQEGSCRIRFAGKEYGLVECPWVEGFRDHQTDTFRVLNKK
jgi:hypothetical protein